MRRSLMRASSHLATTPLSPQCALPPPEAPPTATPLLQPGQPSDWSPALADRLVWNSLGPADRCRYPDYNLSELFAHIPARPGTCKPWPCRAPPIHDNPLWEPSLPTFGGPVVLRRHPPLASAFLSFMFFFFPSSFFFFGRGGGSNSCTVSGYSVSIQTYSVHLVELWTARRDASKAERACDAKNVQPRSLTCWAGLGSAGSPQALQPRHSTLGVVLHV